MGRLCFALGAASQWTQALNLTILGVLVQTSELCCLIDDDAAPEQAAASHVEEVSMCVFQPAGPGSRNPSMDLQLSLIHISEPTRPY